MAIAIDPKKPVTPRDLEALRLKLGLDVAHFCHLMNLAVPQWAELKKKFNDLPINDASLAIYARLLDRHPEFNPVPPKSSPQRALEALQAMMGEDNVSYKKYALMLGREMSGGYRWVVQGKEMPPILHRFNRLLLEEIYPLHASGDPKQMQQAQKLLKEWLSVIEDEAAVRGISDIWEKGGWDKLPKSKMRQLYKEGKLDELKELFSKPRVRPNRTSGEKALRKGVRARRKDKAPEAAEV